ncbi:hypothetical protein F5878DRAFT_627003 [Lentinula raphanica]|uniref:RING-type domain-containing protein n=1 Tax=Lentinula raphanica TaxID=153919 RepID=A0AA38P3T0_9AGAR|nr:hypothetical protein F5878DRAFT_627003 [Lentinula raphanica]
MATGYAPPQQHILLNTNLGSSYNITFNLSTLFSYPSRFLAKFLNKGDAVSGIFADTGLADATTTAWIDSSESLDTFSVAATAVATSSTGTAKAEAAIASAAAFPGPWGFFSSGYMCGLLIMGVLMHRIDNILVPTNPHMFHHSRTPHTARANQNSWSRSFYNRFLPIDINRTSTRLAIHLPTLYLMCRVLLLWGIMLLQTANLFPWTQPRSLSNSDSGNFAQNVFDVLYRLGKWSASWETEDVCWHTFVAICAAFCVEGFVKGLDGNGHGFGFAEHMQANTSPFNLVGYAFLLHIYSSPLTHAFKPHKIGHTNSNNHNLEMLPSRPDTHVLITLAIPLLQLTLFHLLSVRKRWSRHRFLPTALASMLSLAHFHITLGYYLLGKSSKFSAYPATTTITTAATPHASVPSQAYIYTPHHTTHGYPILNYIPNIFETLLISTIILTIFLNILTQLLITGRVDKPLLGLGINTGMGGGSEHNNNNNNKSWITELLDLIPWEEDFGVVLLRVGTASLEATGLRGWGNEVGGVLAPSLASGKNGGVREPSREYGIVRLTRTGVAGVSSGIVAGGGRRHGKEKAQNRDRTGKMRVLRGWNNEVREVDLGSNGPNGPGRRRYGINGILTLNAQWFVELVRFVKCVWAVMSGALKVGLTVGWEVLRGRRKLFQRGRIRSSTRRVHDRQHSFDAGPSSGQGEIERQTDSEGEEQDEVLYRKFLRGESVSFLSDEEDSDYDLPDANQDDEDKHGVVEEEEEEETDSEEELESEYREEYEETVHLYADLSNREPSPGPSTASTMLAHMSYSGSSPLTRRRFASLHKDTRTDGPSSTSSHSDVLGGYSGGMPETSWDTTSTSVAHGSSSSSSGVFDDSRRNCVVCTVEPRVIICWPCRCLAMCDSCRESLAARSSASKHRCPCCRRGVDGYSRIYIP